MAYIGIGYTGAGEEFLSAQVHHNAAWLKGERTVRFFGPRFIVLYDSNTAREFVRICTRQAAHPGEITVYSMTAIEHYNGE